MRMCALFHAQLIPMLLVGTLLPNSALPSFDQVVLWRAYQQCTALPQVDTKRPNRICSSRTICWSVFGAESSDFLVINSKARWSVQLLLFDHRCIGQSSYMRKQWPGTLIQSLHSSHFSSVHVMRKPPGDHSAVMLLPDPWYWHHTVSQSPFEHQSRPRHLHCTAWLLASLAPSVLVSKVVLSPG